MKAVNNNKVLKALVNDNKQMITPAVMISVPKIDKITLVFDLEDEQHQQDIKGYCWDLKKPEYAIDGVRYFSSKAYKAGLEFFGMCADGKPFKESIVIQFDCKKNANAVFCRLEYNPSKVTDQQWAAFVYFLFKEPGIDLPTMLKTAWVTRLDICRDIGGLSMEDFFARSKRKRNAQMLYGSSGELQTLYLGKSSGNQVKIYNKAAEAGLDEVLTRFETALRCRIKLTDLESIKNPFLGIEIFDLMPQGEITDMDLFNCFRDSCRQRGIQHALKHLSPVRRKLFTKLVKGSLAKWWQPEKGWDVDWKKAIETAGLLPTQIMVSSFSHGKS